MTRQRLGRWKVNLKKYNKKERFCSSACLTRTFIFSFLEVLFDLKHVDHTLMISIRHERLHTRTQIGVHLTLNKSVKQTTAIKIGAYL